MLLLISDSSVLIDIENGGLVSAMFSLPYQFAVPDILFAEELMERHAAFIQLGLICKTMSGELITEAYELRQKHPRPSINDLLALTLAKHENCQLLTGDKALRTVAEIHKVEVHGTLWLVHKMVEYQKITVDIACTGLQRMKDTGSHLPWDKVEEMFSKQLEVYH